MVRRYRSDEISATMADSSANSEASLSCRPAPNPPTAASTLGTVDSMCGLGGGGGGGGRGSEETQCCPHGLSEHFSAQVPRERLWGAGLPTALSAALQQKRPRGNRCLAQAPKQAPPAITRLRPDSCDDETSHGSKATLALLGSSLWAFSIFHGC